MVCLSGSPSFSHLVVGRGHRVSGGASGVGAKTVENGSGFVLRLICREVARTFYSGQLKEGVCAGFR